MLASNIIEDARDHHESFMPVLHPDQVLLRYLSRVQQRIALAVTKLNEYALAAQKSFTAGNIATALAGPSPLSTGNFVLVMDGDVTYANQSQREFQLVSPGQRMHMSDLFPSGYLLGQGLYLTDLSKINTPNGAQTGWEDVTSLVIRYVALPADLATTGDTLLLPDLTRDFLVNGLVRFMAARSTPPVTLPGLTDVASEAEREIVTSLAEQDETSTWRVRQV